MKCLNCLKEFIRFDHIKTRKPKFCCHKCFLKYYRNTCIKCEDDSLPHRKYKLRGRMYVRRDCTICEREDKNKYKRGLYNMYLTEVV